MEEKKRRVGKFNVVDIIILVIILVGVVFLGMKLLGNDGEVIGSSVRIEYTVLVKEVEPEVCDNTVEAQNKNGQVQLMANGALVDGYVTSIEVKPHMNYEANDEGKIMISEEEGDHARKDMIFTIQAAADSTVTYKVGTQEIRVGKPHIVKTTEYELEKYDAVILSRVDIG